MSQPAWYPDPSGQPGSFRYWNGQSWSAETTTNPYDPPPAGAQPQTPPQQQPTQQFPVQGQQWQPDATQAQGQHGQQYAQPYEQQPAQQWSPMPNQHGTAGSGGGRGKLWILVAGLVVVLVLIGGGIVAALTMGDDDSDDKADPDPSSQAADPSDGTDAPSPTPSESPSESDQPTTPDPSAAPALETCAVKAPSAKGVSEPGRVAGGGISFPVTPGYSDGPDAAQGAQAFDFLAGPNGQLKVIERTETSGWISMMVVGSVERADGYTDVEQAAKSIANCAAGSDQIYRNVVDVRPLTSEALDSLSGHDAWRVDTEVEVNEPELKSKGDTLVVVAVDTGDPETFAIFVGVVPLDNARLLKRLNEAVAGITVD